MEKPIVDTKNRIFLSAVEIVGLKGDVTVRELAEMAGVNIASINYYYGNKKNLLKEVEKHYSTSLYNLQNSILTSEDFSPYDKLLNWAKSLSEFIIRYPALIGLIVNLTTEDKNYKPALIQKIYLNKDLQIMIQRIIGNIINSHDERVINFRYLQIFSGILGPIINRVVEENFADGNMIVSLSSKEDFEEYIRLLIDSILT
ncbi:MAG: TetR/AcrR family transcriptional regulator [Firmicutes bacterium]|nr:TetR/AcrR family transcriptional regulator [Bacillota bacterium]